MKVSREKGTQECRYKANFDKGRRGRPQRRVGKARKRWKPSVERLKSRLGRKVQARIGRKTTNIR